MKMRSEATLKKYGLTEAAFSALYESQGGLCAICGISEAELEEKYSGSGYWDNDRMLHIDHEHGSSPRRIRGLLCRDCNYGLEKAIREDATIADLFKGIPVPPSRMDKRYAKYLESSS